MQWMEDFQLALFDFDGLLVNTEHLHYQAYQNMCAARGFTLPWDFHTYCLHAHYSSERLRQEIFNTLPELKEQEGDWEILYREKTAAYLKLLNGGKIDLIEGVEQMFAKLEKSSIKRCVVTHSKKVLVDTIRKQLPKLDVIPHWITREDYSHAKPHPEGYLKAIERFANPGDKVIGFEDTPRGIQALLQTCAQPVIITQIHYPDEAKLLEQGVWRYQSFN